MALGLGVLKLAPAAFWAMTPLEFAAAVRTVLPPPVAERIPSRATFHDLMHRFPDQ